jgi:peptidoglycan-N-acetylglucosamine deacetylase
MLAELVTAGAAVTLSAGGYAFAANWPTSQLFGRTILAGDNAQEIALTYDDGPNDPYTLRLLEILARHNVRATFFLIGRFVRERPDIVRQIRAAGHLVGNHTMTHPVLLLRSPKRVREELAACNSAIEDAIGEPVRFFRPPHGARRPDVLRTASELGLAPVMWNVMGYDWTAPPPEKILRHIERKVIMNRRWKKGSNILLHDGGQAHIGMDRGPTIEATRTLLDAWTQGEYRFVTVERWKEQQSGVRN